MRALFGSKQSTTCESSTSTVSTGAHSAVARRGRRLVAAHAEGKSHRALQQSKGQAAVTSILAFDDSHTVTTGEKQSVNSLPFESQACARKN